MSALGESLRLKGARLSAKDLMALEFAPALGKEFPSLSLARRPGVTPTRAAGQGHVIRELRPFAEGDDPRHIDAAASARSGSPQIRGFHEDREGNLLLIADFRRPMLWGSQSRLRSLAGAEVLMRMGWQAMQAGGAVGLVTLTNHATEVTRPRPRHAGLARIAAHMERAHAEALLSTNPTPDLDAALQEALRHAPSGALVALASGLDQGGRDIAGALASLAKRGPVALLLIEDPIEINPPKGPLPTHSASTHATRLVDLEPLRRERQSRLEGLRLPNLTATRINSEEASSGGTP